MKKKKHVENNFYNTYNITEISILDSHCPGSKQEIGNRNSSLFLPHFLLPVMRFTKLNKAPLSNKLPCDLNKYPQGE